MYLLPPSRLLISPIERYLLQRVANAQIITDILVLKSDLQTAEINSMNVNPHTYILKIIYTIPHVTNFYGMCFKNIDVSTFREK